MTTTEQALQGARDLARYAAIRRTGLGSCPYPVDATGQQAAARRAWLAEYRLRRPDEVTAPSFTDELTAIAHGPDDNSGQGPTPAPALLIPQVDGGSA